MLDWLIDVVIFVLVAGFAAYLVYAIFFSGSDIVQRELRRQTTYLGFDRRSGLERRKKHTENAPGASERRQGPRRAGD